MERISEFLSIWLIMRKYSQESDKYKLQFAIEVVLNNLLSFVVIMIFGILLNRIILTFIYVFLFIMFRSLRDRYHASTFLNCFILTIGCYSFCVLLFLVFQSYNYFYVSVILSIINIFIFLKGNFKIKLILNLLIYFVMFFYFII